MNQQSSAPTGEDTVREQIVRTADRLYYEQGILSVGMDSVRDAAGVSLKRLYSLFASKDELVVAVLRLRQQMLREGLESHRDLATDPRERVLSVFDFLDRWFGEPGFRGCGFINAFGELGSRSDDVASVVRETKVEFRTYVEGLVREAGGSDTVALQVVLLAEGAQTTAAITGTPSLIASSARTAAATLLDVDLAATA